MWVYILIGAMGFMAFLGYACCAVAGRADDQLDEWLRSRETTDDPPEPR